MVVAGVDLAFGIENFEGGGQIVKVIVAWAVELYQRRALFERQLLEAERGIVGLCRCRWRLRFA
ncbi:hypothetical protein O0544_20705 [Edwardsiella anguillarum]|nr:hypothetical protein [Edwardsiella anguillarum]